MTNRNVFRLISRKPAGSRRPGSTRPPVAVESLEGRQLLSASSGSLSSVADVSPPRLDSAEFVFAGARRNGKPAGLSLTFSEAIDPATAQAGTIRLATRRGTDGNFVYRSIRILDTSYDQATHTVTLTPDRRAFFPRGARVTVLPGVTDLAGNSSSTKDVVIISRDIQPRVARPG